MNDIKKNKLLKDETLFNEHMRAETRKHLLEGDLYVKKLRWYEIALIFAFGVAIATIVLKY